MNPAGIVVGEIVEDAVLIAAQIAALIPPAAEGGPAIALITTGLALDTGGVASGPLYPVVLIVGTTLIVIGLAGLIFSDIVGKEEKKFANLTDKRIIPKLGEIYNYWSPKVKEFVFGSSGNQTTESVVDKYKEDRELFFDSNSNEPLIKKDENLKMDEIKDKSSDSKEKIKFKIENLSGAKLTLKGKRIVIQKISEDDFLDVYIPSTNSLKESIDMKLGISIKDLNMYFEKKETQFKKEQKDLESEKFREKLSEYVENGGNNGLAEAEYEKYFTKGDNIQPFIDADTAYKNFEKMITQTKWNKKLSEKEKIMQEREKLISKVIKGEEPFQKIIDFDEKENNIKRENDIKKKNEEMEKQNEFIKKKILENKKKNPGFIFDLTLPNKKETIEENENQFNHLNLKKNEIDPYSNEEIEKFLDKYTIKKPLLKDKLASIISGGTDTNLKSTVTGINNNVIEKKKATDRIMKNLNQSNFSNSKKNEDDPYSKEEIEILDEPIEKKDPMLEEPYLENQKTLYSELFPKLIEKYGLSSVMNGDLPEIENQKLNYFNSLQNIIKELPNQISSRFNISSFLKNFYDSFLKKISSQFSPPKLQELYPLSTSEKYNNIIVKINEKITKSNNNLKEKSNYYKIANFLEKYKDLILHIINNSGIYSLILGVVGVTGYSKKRPVEENPNIETPINKKGNQYLEGERETLLKLVKNYGKEKKKKKEKPPKKKRKKQ